MDQPIEMPFVETCVGPRKRVLHGDAHWRHLANTMVRSVQRPAAAITMATCLTFVPFYVVKWRFQAISTPKTFGSRALRTMGEFFL